MTFTNTPVCSSARCFPLISAMLLAVMLIAASVLPGHADDIGLATAKLTEKAGHSYVLETDIPPQLQNRIGVPILPEGFVN